MSGTSQTDSSHSMAKTWQETFEGVRESLEKAAIRIEIGDHWSFKLGTMFFLPL